MPGGQDQIAYAKAVVTERFAEANVLFVLDQLVKGAIRAITGLIGGIAAFLPIPGLSGLVSFINTVIRMSLTYVDEIILGYNIRINSTSPFETARQGVVLYAQNGKTMVKNAIWLAVIMWGVSFVIFLLMLAPAGAILWFMPGQLAGWAFVLAIVFAWAFKAAFIEPFAIACSDAGLFQAPSRARCPIPNGTSGWPKPRRSSGNSRTRRWPRSAARAGPSRHPITNSLT